MYSIRNRSCAHASVISLGVVLSSFDAATAVSFSYQADSVAEVTANANQMLRSESPSRKPAQASPAKAHPAHPDAHAAKAASHTPPAAATTAAKTANVTRIELYYETRCPDCIMFINQSLAPLWQNEALRQHFSLTLNPFGNAQSVPVKEISEGYKFWHSESTGKGFEEVHICQHGPDECFASLIQACAITDEPADKHVALAVCMASKPEYGVEKASYECMQQVKIDPQKNKNCVRSARGNKLFSDMGKATKAVKGRLGTPWVVVDGTYLKDPTKLSETVCDGIPNNNIPDCKPFQQKSSSGSDKAPEQEDDSDEFQVLDKIKRAQRDLMMMPPPTYN